MEIKELKVLFDNGALKAATVTKAMMNTGVFKTTDAAIKNAQEIGFRTITVSLQKVRIYLPFA